jgi:hypothetical protein
MASASASLAATECALCCEKFNNSLRAPITCEFGDCAVVACKTCIRKYILSTTAEPHCYSCKKAWTPLFLVDHLNRSYLTTEYKKHRQGLLLEREISQLPTTMEAAREYTERNTRKERVKALRLQVKALEDQRGALFNEIYRLTTYNPNTAGVAAAEETPEARERRQFVMPCPFLDCRGFLSTQLKCAVCLNFTCVDCNVVIGLTKTEPHICNAEDVQSRALIKAETKPCPTDGTRIFKISGCDQMWCWTCQTAFSWSTGKIDKGIVHNPHFYEYQRMLAAKTGEVAAPRNPGDVVCGGLIGYGILRRQIFARLQVLLLQPLANVAGAWSVRDVLAMVENLHRTMGHITQDSLPTLRQKLRDATNHEGLRVKYIVKELTKDELAAEIYKQDKLRQKYTDIVRIFELLSTVGIEMFNALSDSVRSSVAYKDEVVTHLQQFDVLRLYCNEQFVTIAHVFNHSVPQITADYVFTTCSPTEMKLHKRQQQQQEEGGGSAKKKKEKTTAAKDAAAKDVAAAEK